MIIKDFTKITIISEIINAKNRDKRRKRGLTGLINPCGYKIYKIL